VCGKGWPGSLFRTKTRTILDQPPQFQLEPAGACFDHRERQAKHGRYLLGL